MATRGGAAVLGRDDIGMLAPGMAADFAAFRLDDIAFAGAQHDPLAALIFCGSPRADVVVINGRVVVREGQLVTADVPVLVERHNRLSRDLING
jgi:8-oxoguanine deaminase